MSIAKAGSATIDAAYPALLILEKESVRLLNDDGLKQLISLMDKTRKSLIEADSRTHNNSIERFEDDRLQITLG